MTWYFIILFSLLGGWLARMNGGGWPRTHRWIERTLCIAPFVIVCAPWAGLYAALAYAGTLGFALGHGQYFLARVVQYCDPERVDVVVKLLFGEDPRCTSDFEHLRNIKSADLSPEDRKAMKYAMFVYGERRLYWRCVFGMFLTGMFVGIPAALLALYFGQFLIAFLFLLTGLVKSISYVAGHEIFGNSESAEFTNGILRTMLALITRGV